MNKQKAIGRDYVVLDWKQERYVLIIDPNLAKTQDFEWVEEARSTKFADLADAFETWKRLKKVGVPNLRVAPTGWKH